MLVFDQLKRSDRTLQVISACLLLGMGILIGGLWWLQIVSSKRYEANQKKQSLRSVRVPALRGKILDRNGEVLADNQPQYYVNVYFEEMFDLFRFEYTNSVLKEYKQKNPSPKIPKATRDKLVFEARYRALSNLTLRVSSAFGQPRLLSAPNFLRHMNNNPYVPFPIFQNLSPKQVAIFSEQFSGLRGVELETKSVRVYPNGNVAAHLLGHVKEEPKVQGEEEINFNYYMPDYVGYMGTESAFDPQLRGKAGVKTLLVNSTQYRQREEMSAPTEAGQNVWLTIDLPIQQAVEKALATAMENTRGAAVVMDVRNGDILALASAPTFDPNMFLRSLSSEEIRRLNDQTLRPEFNRATFGGYTPGSIFKIITAIACLESGLNPREEIYNPGEWKPSRNAKPINDTAKPGMYNFERAFKRSSNTYFITNGIYKAGLPKIVEVAQRFHLGEKTLLPTRQEVAGDIPTPDEFKKWTPGRVANLCIGQEITVTPLQMACMTAAIANGGKLFLPRIVSRSEAGARTNAETILYPVGKVRNHIQVSPQHLDLIQHAMLADVEVFDGEEGTGRPAHLPDFQIAGKTGTAEILVKGQKDKNTWFVSFGPYENPRYAVVVMVESGASGGGTCAPVAKMIYEALLKNENGSLKKPMIATLN